MLSEIKQTDPSLPAFDVTTTQHLDKKRNPVEITWGFLRVEYDPGLRFPAGPLESRTAGGQGGGSPADGRAPFPPPPAGVSRVARESGRRQPLSQRRGQGWEGEGAKKKD